MWQDCINTLLIKAAEKYPEITAEDQIHSKKAFVKRSVEIFTYTDAIERCMDQPYKDPEDILYLLLLDYEMQKCEMEHKEQDINTRKRIKELRYSIKVIQWLISVYWDDTALGCYRYDTYCLNY